MTALASRAGLSDGAGYSDHVWLLEHRTYFLSAGLNLLCIPIVFFFDPETKDCCLESVEAMFMPSHPLYPKMELAYRIQRDVLAMRGVSFSAPPAQCEGLLCRQGCARSSQLG